MFKNDKELSTWEELYCDMHIFPSKCKKWEFIKDFDSKRYAVNNLDSENNFYMSVICHADPFLIDEKCQISFCSFLYVHYFIYNEISISFLTYFT